MTRARLVGTVSIVVIVLLLVGSFQLGTVAKLVSGGGTTYHAQFTDASSIAPGDPVRIAGIPVGKVTGVHVQGTHVLVDFRVDHAPRLADDTRASLELDTLLGQHSLGLQPGTSGGTLAHGATITLDRTNTPFSVQDALIGTANKLSTIDSQALAKALSTVSAALDPAAPEVRTAAVGVSSLARAVGDRDGQVQQLFASTAQIAKTLAGQSGQITALIRNSGLVLQTLDERQAVIRALLEDTAQLSATISAVVDENTWKLTPGLAQLKTVLGVLEADKAQLDASLRLLAPYLRYFTNLTGNGRWFDGYVAGLLPVDLNDAGGAGAPAAGTVP